MGGRSAKSCEMELEDDDDGGVCEGVERAEDSQHLVQAHDRADQETDKRQ